MNQETFYKKKQQQESTALDNKKQNLEDYKTILYIEDNPVNIKLVEKICSLHPKLKLVSTHLGELGLAMAKSQKLDLILLDINLPGLNGFEVVKELKQDTNTQHIPVIALSANVLPRDIEKGRQAGFDDYVTKPINVKLLLEKFEEFL